MRSYAQNFEDVILWRAFRDMPSGFYIDLGAQHPVHDSVSRWFYEQGWRGIHAEPTSYYADLIREDRPDEEVVQAAISNIGGDHIIHFFPGTGLSTISPEVALNHQSNGREWVEETVPSLTLEQLFDKVGDRPIHWLKIDVEGAERSVLESWRDSPARPWIMLVESTYPMSRTETHDEWEELILERDYEFVYADGLNRFYLHADHAHLKELFRFPPNVFDEFSLMDHWATRELRASQESCAAATLTGGDDEAGVGSSDVELLRPELSLMLAQLSNIENYINRVSNDICLMEDQSKEKIITEINGLSDILKGNMGNLMNVFDRTLDMNVKIQQEIYAGMVSQFEGLVLRVQKMQFNFDTSLAVIKDRIDQVTNSAK
ncbi:FkbM family methyltransferase [Sphingobium limneticum]|jgi:FkbM family methyltransferase|uniref:FkbM family methyltransferase n=1 Tax=Sphingobium TaxID=165695 RepID=UPI003137B4BD